MVERENRTLLDMMRSILNQANMPFEGFWELALEPAVYIKNRLPSATRNNETWTGRTSSIGHITPFGCIIDCHLSDEQRQTKAVVKAIKCCIVGYRSSNMYLAYDPRTGKTRLSRHHSKKTASSTPPCSQMASIQTNTSLTLSGATTALKHSTANPMKNLTTRSKIHQISLTTKQQSQSQHLKRLQQPPRAFKCLSKNIRINHNCLSKMPSQT